MQEILTSEPISEAARRASVAKHSGVVAVESMAERVVEVISDAPTVLPSSPIKSFENTVRETMRSLPELTRHPSKR